MARFNDGMAELLRICASENWTAQSEKSRKSHEIKPLTEEREMGTRSLTHIHEDGKDSAIIATIYRQFDGYPTGIGADIKDAGVMRIVNGYSMGDVAGAAANGMSCYAAQLVAVLKEGKIGNVYLYPPGAKDCGEDYTYNIWTEGGELHISVGEMFSGRMADFDPEKVEAADA